MIQLEKEKCRRLHLKGMFVVAASSAIDHSTVGSVVQSDDCTTVRQ